MAPYRFPCIGHPCLAHRIWHEAGAIELTLQAEKGVHRQSDAQWQHLCESCADAGEHRRWEPVEAAGSSSGAAPPVPPDDPMNVEDEDDAALEAAAEEVEQAENILRAGGNVFGTAQPQPPAQQVALQVPPLPPPTRYISHGSKDDVGEVKQQAAAWKGPLG